MKLLFVCLGNICRSPIADGVMRRLITEHALDWEIDSAGTGGWHVGEPPDPRAIHVARKYGTDISGLRARKFVRKDFERFDKIYALDLQNLKDILALARTDEDREKVELFLEAAFPGRREGVRDPWYGDDLFDPVYQEIHEACENLLHRLRNGNGSL
jgi:protein-tyrosine phosphatase